MSDFNLENVFDTVKSTAVELTKTATSVVENKTKEAKLSYTLKKLESRVNDQFSAIGASVYLSFKEGTEQEDFSEMFGRIDALNDEIEDLRSTIAHIKNTSVCPECNAYITNDKFCSKCGAKLKNDE